MTRQEEKRGRQRQMKKAAKVEDPDMSDYTPIRPDQDKGEGGLVITDDALLQDRFDSLEEPTVKVKPYGQSKAFRRRR